jgi:hypothetical protein
MPSSWWLGVRGCLPVAEHENTLLVVLAASEAAGGVELFGGRVVGEDPHLWHALVSHPAEHLVDERSADAAPPVAFANADRVEQQLAPMA